MRAHIDLKARERKPAAIAPGHRMAKLTAYVARQGVAGSEDSLSAAQTDIQTAILPADFRGRWHVRRRIRDAQSGQVTLFQGMALLTATGFDESGRMQFHGQSFPAQRLYRLDWQQVDVRIRRVDGSDFVTLSASADQRVEHLCGRDLYRGRFVFAGRDRWLEAWSVRGPQKNYCSFGQFRRA